MENKKHRRYTHSRGEMPEWSNGAVSKTVVPSGTGGSNPSLSARFAGNNFSHVFLRYSWRPSEPQYSWAVANFKRATHAHLGNCTITPKSPFLFFDTCERRCRMYACNKILILLGFSNFGLLTFVLKSG
jgi:hypothetical protein